MMEVNQQFNWRFHKHDSEAGLGRNATRLSVA
jgi:hypothetical protein